MSQPRLFTWLFVAAIAACVGFYRAAIVNAGDEWQPISPEELKMTSVAEAPGAAAVILYRQVDRDDNPRTGHEYDYIRTKILTEEGRKYADVEIPYLRDNGSIVGIAARTIHPDGTIVNFAGKAFDKTIVKAKGVKFLAKTFTMPDVQVGSLIEYHYTYDLKEGYVYDSEWTLSQELFTRLAKFSLIPNKDFSLRWSWPVGLPGGAPPPKREPTGTVRMTATNIPALVAEDYMPPEDELKFRVEFMYTQEAVTEQDPEKFWKKQAKKYNDGLETFIGKRKLIEQTVAQAVSPGDSPEIKLSKLYERVEKIHNTSFDLQKTEQEEKRLKEKGVASVEDVLRENRADERQINWTMVALARAAGLEAYSVYVAARNQYIFHPELMNTSQLDTDVVLVKAGGKDVFCDPGAKYAPLGLLPWYETGVRGLRLDKNGGTWVDTPIPDSADSKIERRAELKLLQEDGSLTGKLTVTFTGLEAVSRRTDERNEDETERKKFLEEEVREYIPSGSEVELKNKPDWESASPALVATYDLKVPGWASAAGRRALVPVGLFSASEKQLFEHASREYPVYFHFPYEKIDDITIDLPLGWHVSSVPKETGRDAKAALYNMKVENKNDTLHLSRVLRSDLVLVDVKSYLALRAFYQVVRTGDEQQIVVQPGVAAVAN